MLEPTRPPPLLVSRPYLRVHYVCAGNFSLALTVRYNVIIMSIVDLIRLVLIIGSGFGNIGFDSASLLEAANLQGNSGPFTTQPPNPQPR
jgi:hypothetical protein